MLESELFAFLENAADAVFVMTDQGEIRFWNKSAEKLLGYSALRGQLALRSCKALAFLVQRFVMRTVGF